MDPTTGALINVNEHQTVSLRNPSTGAQALLLFDADLIATPATVNAVVALDTNGRNKLNLIEIILPLASASSASSRCSPASCSPAGRARTWTWATPRPSPPPTPPTPPPGGAAAPWEHDGASANVVPGLQSPAAESRASEAPQIPEPEQKPGRPAP